MSAVADTAVDDETLSTGSTLAPECSEETYSTDTLAPEYASENIPPFFVSYDFDFDVAGHLVTPLGPQLFAFDASGYVSVLNPTLSDVPSAIRFLPDGDLLLAMPNLGVVRRLEVNGGGGTVLGGMTYPYALETGIDGIIYVAEHSDEGRIFSLISSTGVVSIVAEIPYAVSLALSADEETLYISSIDPGNGGGRISSIARTSSGAWDAQPTLLYSDGWRLDAMATDLCGNLYLGTGDGRVLRLRDDIVETIAALPTGHLYAAHFGASYGSFEQTTLYVTDGAQLFPVPVGIRGRHVLAP